MNICKFCGVKTKNKVYCSEKCQYSGYRKLQKETGHILTLKCVFCKNEFQIKKSRNRPNKKYCSRKCCDEHKKTLQLGENNGMFGKKENRNHKKERLNKVWSNPNIKNNIKKSLIKFKQKNGYWPGSDEISVQKRKNTFLKKYGVDHNWKVKHIRDKCEKTCVEKYGKHSWEILNDILQTKSTSIENKIEKILKQNNIDYVRKYRVSINDSYKEYDFYLPQLNLLIECDGDFWHTNPKIFNEPIYEVQKINKENDLIKTKLAKNKKFKLVRYWESFINTNEFEKLFLEDLNGYDKN